MLLLFIECTLVLMLREEWAASRSRTDHSKGIVVSSFIIITFPFPLASASFNWTIESRVDPLLLKNIVI